MTTLAAYHHTGASDQVMGWIVHAAVWHEVGALLRTLPPAVSAGVTGLLVLAYVLRRRRSRVHF